MIFFALLTAVVLVLIAVSIHLGAMRSMYAVMPRWTSLNRYRASMVIMVTTIWTGLRLDA